MSKRVKQKSLCTDVSEESLEEYCTRKGMIDSKGIELG